MVFEFYVYLIILCTKKQVVLTKLTCFQFRKEIIKSPVKWWREWKDLLGNRNVDDRVYDVLGELCVLNQLLAKGEDASWNGPSCASYDIETEIRFVEVKSSIVRDRKEITISSLLMKQEM